MDEIFLQELVGQEAAQQILQRHRQEMDALRCDHALASAIRAAGGRSEIAIGALLDRNAIAAAEDMQQAAERAVAQLKREHGYLFAMPVVSSPGTGRLTVDAPFSMDDVGKMSMEEYRKWRGM